MMINYTENSLLCQDIRQSSAPRFNQAIQSNFSHQNQTYLIVWDTAKTISTGPVLSEFIIYWLSKGEINLV